MFNSPQSGIATKTDGNNNITASFQNDGSIVYIHNGYTYNGITFEQHERLLRKQDTQIRKDLKKLHGVELENAQLKLDNLQQKLTHLEASYHAKQNEQLEQITFLVKNDFGHNRLKSANDAFIAGDKAQAIALFQDIYDDKENNVEILQLEAQLKQRKSVKAEAAFQLGKIAFDDIRWSEALVHFERAYELEGENEDYIFWFARLNELHLQYKLAIDLRQKLIHIAEHKHQGYDHLDKAIAYNNISQVYKALGDYNNAELFALKDIEICKSIYSEKHENELGISYGNLSTLYSLQNKKFQAVLFAIESIRIGEMYKSTEHSYLACAYNNFAILLYQKAKYLWTEKYFKKAVSLVISDLPINHPERKNYIKIYANFLIDRERIEEAIILLNENGIDLIVIPNKLTQ